MVSAYLQNNKLFWVSVGDSHLYLVRDRELIKQNADHSYGAYLDMMKEQGMDVDEQAGMSRNMLMSAMTGEEISSIDVSGEPIKVRAGDRIIVASDGLDTLGAGAIIQYSSWSSTAKECVYALLKAVEDASKINQDNTTLIVVDIKERKPAIQTETGQVAAKQNVSRVADVQAFDEYREPRSYKWLVWVVLLGGIAAGGYLAWSKGLVDQWLNAANQTIEEQLTPDPVPEPEAVPVPVKQPEPVPEPKPEPVFTDKADAFRDSLKSGGRGPLMILVAGNNYRMGGASSIIAADEVPRHEVTIQSLMVSVYEVTYAEYDRFASATGRSKPASKGWDRKVHPVSDVSWNDALAYTRWLSVQTGEKYRLLSESEWEYVARAGTSTSYWWGTTTGSGNAHCFDCKTDFSTSKPAKIGTYKPNNFGLYDTAGNLFEWVHDCYHRNYTGAPIDGSVWEGGDCQVRVVRGGAYQSPSSSMRVENREQFKSNKGQYNVGIRVARDP
jgi:formylglycine-generating enzyme required for sulfatase activity